MKYLNKELSEKIIGAALEVHNTLGPGFLEYVYEEAFCYELEQRKIPFERQKVLDVHYKELVISKKYKCDVLVDANVLVELKATSGLSDIDQAQLLHYLKATGIKVGLMLNFGTKSLEVKRRVY